MKRSSAHALVIGLVVGLVFGPMPLGTTNLASAAGWDCKDAPPAERGNACSDFVDSDAEQAAPGDGTNYGTYGWGGLKWSSYDLGCGPDIILFRSIALLRMQAG